VTNKLSVDADSLGFVFKLIWVALKVNVEKIDLIL
jgi:hypothetical protein